MKSITSVLAIAYFSLISISLSSARAQATVEDDLAIGAALFNGKALATNLSAIVGGASVPATRFACQGCHGQDGRGGVEGDVPSIAWLDLVRRSSERGAYDEKSFATAVTGGMSVTGRALSRLMPRYDLNEVQLASVQAYLRALPNLQRTGVTSDEIRIGLPMTTEARGLLVDYAEVLEQALLEATPEKGLFGRQIRLIRLEGDAQSLVVQAAKNVAVIVAPADTELATKMAQVGLPVLFPLKPMHDTDENDLIVPLLDSWQTLSSRLAYRISADKVNNPIIASVEANPGFKQEVENQLLRLSNASAAGKIEPVFMDAREIQKLEPGKLKGRTFYGLTSSVGRYAEQITKSDARLVLLVENEALVRRAVVENLAPLQIHARLVSEYLKAALVEAGRDVSRVSIAKSFHEVVSTAGIVARSGAESDFIEIE